MGPQESGVFIALTDGFLEKAILVMSGTLEPRKHAAPRCLKRALADARLACLSVHPPLSQVDEAAEEVLHPEPAPSGRRLVGADSDASEAEFCRPPMRRRLRPWPVKI